MLASLGLLGALLLLVGGIGLWCHRLSARLRTLDRISMFDSLTGLGNSRLFESERWPSALRAEIPLAVLYIDLDQLKQRNNRYGRVDADRYVAQAAAVLRSACRRGVDEIFRLYKAGDEFVVLIRGLEAQQASTIAENILGRLRAQGISASIGAAWTRAIDHRERARLLDAAEQASHHAKAAGKGHAVVAAIPDVAASDESAAVPELLEQEQTVLRPHVRRCDQAPPVLYRIRDDVRLAFPTHRISLTIVETLPPLAVEEDCFTLVTVALLLYVASISRHLHITAGAGMRTGLTPDSADEGARMLRVCVEFTANRAIVNPSLLEVCKRVCVQEGGAWTVQTNCICLAWPLVSDSHQMPRLAALDSATPMTAVGGTL